MSGHVVTLFLYCDEDRATTIALAQRIAAQITESYGCPLIATDDCREWLDNEDLGDRVGHSDD